jgi:hypothetical protein
MCVPFITDWYQSWKNHNKFENKIEMKRLYAWGPVDSIIEDELQHPNFMAEEEIDGTLVEYSLKFKQLSYLVLFGAAWPLAFLVAWVTNLLDRFWIMKRMSGILRRATPKGSQDIGSWAMILSYLSVLGVFFNAALAAFTIHVIEPSCDEQKEFLCDPFTVRMLTVYVYLGIGLFFRVLAAIYIDPQPRRFKDLILRQQKRLEFISNANKLPQLARTGLTMNLPRQIVEKDIQKKAMEKVDR